MKLTLNNIGPIHHFEFDLSKDIHLLYGKNNVGKSYAVNFLYCFLSSFMYHDAVKMFDSVNNEASAIDEHIEKVLKNRLSQKVQSFNSFLAQTYSAVSSPNSLNARINCEADAFSFTLLYKKKIGFFVEKVMLKTGHSSKNPLVEVDDYTGKYRIIKEKFKDVFDPDEHQYALYFMPSSRSSLYDVLNGMGQLLAALSNVNLPEKLKQFRLPSLQYPVASYYLQLTKMIGNDFERLNDHRIVNVLEQEILKGNIVTNSNDKRIYFEQGKSRFHITETSSLVSELAPLVLYVKNLLGNEFEAKNKILVIEEPEAHLHPEIQVKLMDVFIELARQGVKIVMTSHSNYMFNKLSNSLLEGYIEPEKVGIYQMEMTKEGSILRNDVEATKEGIEDHNFAAIAEQLYNERLEIYHQLNEDQDAYHATKKG
ncbi:MAG: AAA family ATPase [Bacteroidota bacterium]